MFGKKKQLLEKITESVDKFQQNEELLVTAINQLVSKNENTNKKYSEEEKLRAAYALNLCTVSVSQIIDYDDLYILEQEYEMILNNLNLEQMPKDEALLSILKQLLDTITFFRIQEGDKQFIEREYQQKMKNAIWSAVPNLGIVLAGGNLLTTAVSLASQVGIGYMNYRKNKEEYTLERDRKRWQLQRAAMEQFNGLRRELFDTAWRLADAYDFPDEYRLTERQIRQYNDILMDDDEFRKFERLSSIQEKFKAYPPFWYYLGSVANSIAQNEKYSLEDDVRNYYKSEAMRYFQEYEKVDQFKLLRENQITAMWALEYIDLLEPSENQEIIERLLRNAVAMSSTSYDTLQLCALAYLKIGCIEEAIVILKKLINEQYNTIINAQMYSAILVSRYIVQKKNEDRIEYEILEERLGKRYLFPWPKDNDDDLKKLSEHFFVAQGKILSEKYRLVMNYFKKKYSLKFDKIILVPDARLSYSDEYYSDAPNIRNSRFEEMKRVFRNPKLAYEYGERLYDSGFLFKYLEIFNEIIGALHSMGILSNVWQCVNSVKSKFGLHKEKFNVIQEKLEKKQFGIDDFSFLFLLRLDDFMKEVFDEHSRDIQVFIGKIKTMENLADAEMQLRKFCIEQDIPEPDDLYAKRYTCCVSKRTICYFDASLLGVDEKKVVARNIQKEMRDVILHMKTEIELDKTKTEIYVKDDQSFDKYFSDRKFKNESTLKRDTIAIIDDKGSKLSRGWDLFLTVDGIKSIKRLNKPIVRYDEVQWDERELMIGEYAYKNERVNLEGIKALAEKLSRIVKV